MSAVGKQCAGNLQALFGDGLVSNVSSQLYLDAEVVEPIQLFIPTSAASREFGCRIGVTLKRYS